MKLKSLLIILILAFESLAFSAEKAPHQYEAVFNEHVKLLKHLDQINPQLMVFISGAFGMGKTEVSKQIEEKFQAVRLSGDQMRELLVQAGFNRDEVNDYLVYCIHKLHVLSNNRMFIIDRTYNDNQELYQTLLEECGSLKFTIRLEVPKEVAHERVIKRGKDVDFLLSCFDDSYTKHQEIGQKEVFDYTIDNSQKGFKLDEALFEKIQSRFQFHNPKYGTKAFQETRNAIIEYAESGRPVALTSNFSTILPGLYIGNQKTVIEMLPNERAQITDVISCRSKPDKVEMNVNHWLFLQIEDCSEYPIIDYFEDVFTFLEKGDKGVFVHCYIGSSRSSAVMAAYLMRKYWIPFSTAYAYIKKKHRKTQEFSFFEDQLLEYQEILGM